MDITLVLPGRKIEPPLAAYYLLGNLERQGHGADLRYLNVTALGKGHDRPFDLGKMREILLSAKATIAIGCMNDLLPYVLFVLRENREAIRGKTIILGGTGPSEIAEEILQRFDFIGYVVKDRDPAILATLLTHLESGQETLSINGVVQRHGEKLHYAPANADFFHNYVLPEKPFPNQELARTFYLITVEGCPYKCTFCDATQFLERRLHYRNMDDVVAEIKWALDRMGKGVTFFIVDEAFIVKRKWVLQFCETLKAHRLDIKWRCYGRIDRVDEELLAILRDAGCTGMYYGIEGGTDAILDKVKKNFGMKIAMERLILAKKYIRDVTASFIWGYPFESHEDFLHTLAAIHGLHHKGIITQLHQLAPVRNTEIYREYRDMVVFSKNNTHSSVTKPLAIEPQAYRLFIEENADIFLAYSSFATPDTERKVEALSRIRKV